MEKANRVAPCSPMIAATMVGRMPRLSVRSQPCVPQYPPVGPGTTSLLIPSHLSSASTRKVSIYKWSFYYLPAHHLPCGHTPQYVFPVAGSLISVSVTYFAFVCIMHFSMHPPTSLVGAYWEYQDQGHTHSRSKGHGCGPPLVSPCVGPSYSMSDCGFKL